MPRPEKVQAVEEIKTRFSDASASFITEYRGLTVGQQQALRNALRDAGASYTVLKMSLTRRALDELGHNDLDEYLTGPTAIAFAGTDPVPVAKALKDFGAEHEALVVKAGWLNGEILLPETVAKLASIESREVLLAKIAGAAKAPLTKLAGMLGSMTRDAASMFSQLLEMKEQDAPAEAPEPQVDEAEAEDATPADEAAAASPPETGDAAEADDSAEDASAEDASNEDASTEGASTEDDAPPADEADTADASADEDDADAPELSETDQEEPAAEDAADDGDDAADADDAPAEEE